MLRTLVGLVQDHAFSQYSDTLLTLKRKKSAIYSLRINNTYRPTPGIRRSDFSFECGFFFQKKITFIKTVIFGQSVYH